MKNRLVTLKAQRVRSAWLFLLPMLTVLMALALWPLLRTVYFSLTDATLDNLSQARWVGFDNYLSQFDYGDGDIEWSGVLADTLWWKSVWNTVRFALISVSLETLLGLIIALILHKKFIGRTFLRVAILVPWAIPTIISAKIWVWMLNDQFGIINEIMMNLSIIDEPIAWTASIDTAMIAVIMVDVWKTTPFMALLILAALQTLPKDIYEAADVDGIHPVKQLFFITLPMIRPALLVAVIFRTLDALRIFDLIYVLTPGSEQTLTMSVYARQHLFEFDKFSYGSVASTLLFFIVAGFTLCYIYWGRLNLSGQKTS